MSASLFPRIPSPPSLWPGSPSPAYLRPRSNRGAARQLAPSAESRSVHWHVAQMAEHPAVNRAVAGSIPAVPAKPHREGGDPVSPGAATETAQALARRDDVTGQPLPRTTSAPSRTGSKAGDLAPKAFHARASAQLATCGWSRKDNLVRSAWMAAGSTPLLSIVHEVTNG